jgi:acetylornithine/succinyldiaminopimelate/putrescine aminotransferase
LLAQRLCERSTRTLEGPRPAYSNVFFANSGSGAVEAALKLARAATGRTRILSLDGAYHGCTMGSCALMKAGMFKDPFGPHVPNAGPIPFNDLDALARAFSEGDVAALVIEPIQLEGGVRTVSPEYLAAACELTERHGALLVADEIQTGLGRTGRFLASECWPRRPDALILGKHLGGGLVPISAMLTREELFERAYGKHYASAEAHNTTFGGSALCCVAALAALDLLTDDVISRVASVGDRFRAKLSATLARHELFERVKGAGLLVGIELRPSDHPWLSFEHMGVEALVDQPSVGVLLCHRLYKRGFYCFACGHDWRILRVLPRFLIEESTLDQFVAAADEELEYLCSLQ